MALCSLELIKKVCKYLFLIMQGKNNLVLTTGALSKKRVERLSRAVYRTTCG